MFALLQTLLQPVADLLRVGLSTCRSTRALAAENHILRRQLALYKERGCPPGRINTATKISLVLLSKWEAMIRWHRLGWRLFWRYKSKPGRPRIPQELQLLIGRMACENPSWGEERIANELLLKLGLRVSPPTVRRNMPRRPAGVPRGDQRRSTFLRNHAEGIVACDFFVSITATFQLLYVFAVMEHASRRIIDINVTRHPTAAWTTQQLREAVDTDAHQYLLRDRDSIFSEQLDESIRRIGVQVLKSPPRSPKANAYCERLIGTIRRECLDWLIPLSEVHLRKVLRT